MEHNETIQKILIKQLVFPTTERTWYFLKQIFRVGLKQSHH